MFDPMARPAVDRELLAVLDNNLGAPNTDKLLALMPPDWTLLATKHDVVVLGADLRGEMSALRGEMSALRGEMNALRGELHGEISALRGEMDGLRGELRAEMAELRAELRAEIAELRTELVAQRGDIFTTLQQELRKQTIFFIGTLIAVAGVLVGTRALG
jgi:hypothetical protein